MTEIGKPIREAPLEVPAPLTEPAPVEPAREPAEVPAEPVGVVGRVSAA